PFLLSGSYAPAGGPSMPLTIAIFFVAVTASNYYVSWLRLRTGSIWPCIIAHAAWNAVTQIAFNPAATGAMSKLWIGESGILETLVLIVVVVVLFQVWPLRQIFYKPGLLIGQVK